MKGNKTDWDRYYARVSQDSNKKAVLEKAGLAHEISMLIYSLRQSSGLTQSEFAKLVGMKQPDISRLEKADYEGYSLRTLQKIASAVNATLSISFRQKE